jgi:ketosteroid isomerase-like protein
MSDRSFAVIAVLALLAFVALAPPPAAAEPTRDELVAQVRSAELAFAATVKAKDAAAFAAMIDDDAVFVGTGGVSRGRARIVADWASLFAAEAPEFVWHPEIVELSGDGTLGLTRGPWTMRGHDAAGELLERQGLFNSVWRRQRDGSWRVIFDAGCAACPACG